MIDLSDPHAPYVAGQIALNGPADGVAAAGRTVFVATNLGGLQIVDASNPAASGSVLVADDDFGVQVLPMHCPDRESAAAPALQPTPGVRFTAMPNPAPAGVPVRLTLYLAADGGTVLAGERSAGVAGPVRLFDAGGRLVRTLAPAHPAAGVEWIWDGRDEHGRVVPAGVYWAGARPRVQPGRVSRSSVCPESAPRPGAPLCSPSRLHLTAPLLGATSRHHRSMPRLGGRPVPPFLTNLQHTAS